MGVILHHPQAIPGFTIKTRDGCHYTYDGNCEIEVPDHLATLDGQSDKGHVAELVHQSRGHRRGPHPDHAVDAPKPNINPTEKYSPPTGF